MLGISGSPIDQIGDDSAILDYQRRRLGRKDADSLLAELFPVPKSGLNSFSEIHSRLLGIEHAENADPLEAYRQSVLIERQNLLAEILRERFAKGPTSQPRLIVGYGRPWSLFEAVFHKIGPLRYTHDPEGRFKWAEWNGCLFVLTWHPTARERWESMKFGLPVAKRIVEIYRNQFGM